MSKTAKHSDKEILRAIRKKGALGWELFYTQFDPMIQSIVRRPRWKFTEHEQEDVCQNIYISIQRALPKFKEKSSLKWFIKRICHFQCVDEVRRQVTQRTWTFSSNQKMSDGEVNEIEFSCPKTLDPHHEIAKKECREALRDALNQLQSTCQNSIRMFYLKNLSYREISKQLGISVNTVGSRLSKCLTKLQKEMRQKPLFKRNES